MRHLVILGWLKQFLFITVKNQPLKVPKITDRSFKKRKKSFKPNCIKYLLSNLHRTICKKKALLISVHSSVHSTSNRTIAIPAWITQTRGLLSSRVERYQAGSSMNVSHILSTYGILRYFTAFHGWWIRFVSKIRHDRGRKASRTKKNNQYQRLKYSYLSKLCNACYRRSTLFKHIQVLAY